ncbi:MAG: hypothetical protein ABSD76_14565 [Terriglobales bacterium]|jgi:hypothetical protein
MNWRVMLVVLTLAPFLSLQAQQPQPTNEWKDFDFLIGEWTWVGGGRPGQGKGVSTFRPEMNGTVLVRKTHLDYPATKERAAFGHDDLIYVYHDPQDNSVRAIFFDGEGHVIRYAATVASGGNSIEFLSDAAPGGTRCRMTYARAGADTVTEKFEIAPPGKPNDFATYVEFTANKVRP